jgi:integrase/recombinase XerD
LQPALYNALLGYRTNIGLSADDTLFVNRYGNAIDKRSIEKMVRAAAKSVGINKPVTPHWFRHSAGTSALYNGANIHQVQQMLGHSSVATTNAYLHSINKLRDSATDFIKVDM